MFLDFAHAPSKVKATVNAFKETYCGEKLVACLELHTFSSLNMEYIPQYFGSLDEADHAMVYYNPEVVKRKHLPELSPEDVKKHFGKENLTVYNDSARLRNDLKALGENTCILLLMTSGNFSGIDLNSLAKEVAGK